MKGRALPVAAACCALLAVAVAQIPQADKNNPVGSSALPQKGETQEPRRPPPRTLEGSRIFSGPPECNPILGRELPAHCRSQSNRPSDSASSQPPIRRAHPDPSNRDKMFFPSDLNNPARAVALQTAVSPNGRTNNPATDATGHRATNASRTAFNGSDDDDVYVPFAGQRLDSFDWHMVRELNQFARSNAVVSPVGVKLVLGLLHEAASHASAAELRKALGLPAGRPSARDTFRRIIETLQEKQQGYIMKVGNRIFLDQSYEPRSYIDRIYNTYYNAKFQSVPFRKPSAAKLVINEWVSNFTNGKIKNLITNDLQVTNLITMVLNVIYFKGNWLYPFSKESTAKGPFYINSKETVSVDYMHITKDFYYLESEKLDAKILRLPYEGKKYSMFLILPNQKENFNKMIQLITPALMREQLHSLSKMEVKVKLPKFTFQYTVHLKELLQKLGITRIFTESQEINMTKDRTNMMISKVVQKVALEVNEEGTEVTSVTEIDIENHFGGMKMFMATHPFLFFVEEVKTGTIVFVGKVTDPSYIQSVTPPKPLGVNSTRTTGLDTVLEKDFSKDISQQPENKDATPVNPPQ